MQETASRKREPRSVWEDRYRQWTTSGLSQVAFCREQGLKVATFQYWCRAFRAEPVGARADSGTSLGPVGFLPVKIAEMSEHRASAPRLSLHIGDVILNVSGEVTGEQLYHWVKAVRSAVCSV